MSSKMRQCPYGPTNTFTFQTPIGHMAMTCCPKGLHTLGMAGEITDENFSPKPSLDVCLLSQLYQDNGYMYKPANQCLQWLQSYFHNKDNHDIVKPNICQHIGKEGSFRYKVWFTLLNEIPFGKTISYKCLAELCGNAKACRAVGQAMSNNPVSFVIPCHRVIQENGGLGNYSHGTRNKMKEWLLRHEGVLR
ncbi:methylated-DNA--protein-cysteine methyltransferase-like isoform X2 [Ruditapes philippinarum]|nr:methylated-DNA--protein-cysteine methyltransferase-like isoform X2 [Ruditapes philippinarum]XP_060595227.1 methylated-DNA--protein-cysteine methyltransferase-like isoform X2 [Ruditapes philippinarum]XP_060595228.1 methylated-DNA--protein-cysteine methyltransferase-like isoform X2 [Ruditapes philippinarum]